MIKNFRKKGQFIICCLLLIVSLCACGDSDRGKVVFTTALAKDELFRIDKVSCTMAEYMLYLTNVQNRYETALGPKIWEVDYQGMTLGDNVKDNVLAQIARMKSVYLLALEKEVTLTEREEELLAQAAKKYVASLSGTEVEALGVTEELVLQLYKENALADKVYQQIIAQINPEISDDEARTITVEQIYMKTAKEDKDGNMIPYSEDMKKAVLTQMEEIRQMAVDGESGFTELAGKYSEKEEIRISFQKEEMDMALEKVAFGLQTEEISPVFEAEDGYYLLKCISTFDRAQTDANKLVIIEKRKNEAFRKEYDAFVEKKARKLNEKLWEQVELNRTAGVDTVSFFEVYEECIKGF